MKTTLQEKEMTTSKQEDCELELRPMCLDDVTNDILPESYGRIRSFFSAEELNSNKVLAIAVFIIAMESGFTSFSTNEICYSFNSLNIKRISSHSVVGRLRDQEEYTFLLYLGASSYILQMKPFCEKFLINLFSPNLLVCFSEILNITSYVRDNSLNGSKLKELSVNCKNKLFYPMKSFHSERYKLKFACLLDLPSELFIFIVKFLSMRDFLNLSASCRYLYYNFKEDGNIRRFIIKNS